MKKARKVLVLLLACLLVVLVQGAGSFGLVTVAPFTAVMAGTILTRHGRSRDRDEQLRLPDGKDE